MAGDVADSIMTVGNGWRNDVSLGHHLESWGASSCQKDAKYRNQDGLPIDGKMKSLVHIMAPLS